MKRVEGSESFNLESYGTLGVFQPKDHPPLLFLQTTWDIRQSDPELDFLRKAKDVLNDQLTFNELIQREIIKEHVDEIENYLTVPSNEHTIIPPLICGLLPTEGAAIAEDYPSAHIEYNDDRVEVRFGATFMIKAMRPDPKHREPSIRLPKINGQEGDYSNILSYGVVLKVKTKFASLVVVDGQHRLEAIKGAFKSNRITGCSIPVFIFIPIEGPKTQKLAQRFRKVFLDINKNAKSVSGHFIVLLSDQNLLSFAVRAVGERFRKRNKLMFLEWNEEHSTKSKQFSRHHTICSVGVLASALEKPFVREERNLRDTLGSICSPIMDSNNEPEGSDEFVIDRGFASTVPIHLRSKLEDPEGPVQATLAGLSALFEELEVNQQLAGEAEELVQKYESSEVPAMRSAAAEFRASRYPKKKKTTKPTASDSAQQLQDALRDLDQELKKVDVLNSNFCKLVRTQRFYQAAVGVAIDLFAYALRSEASANFEQMCSITAELINRVFLKNGTMIFAKDHSPQRWTENVIFTASGSIITSESTARAIHHLLFSSLVGVSESDQTLSDLLCDSIGLGAATKKAQFLKLVDQAAKDSLEDYKELLFKSRETTFKFEYQTKYQTDGKRLRDLENLISALGPKSKWRSSPRYQEYLTLIKDLRYGPDESGLLNLIENLDLVIR
ncbi:MAG TPA: DNA sulfur modification protein DndB [Pseudobdellovibrionaceae bacterium]|nr:DNA sulfur modification protein DndB [Pseudobdellovibrionaceae bacterium]